MRTRRQLTEEIDATITTQAITQTFEEISAARMQTMRASIVKTRQFLDEVDQVYHEVKRAYVAWYQAQGGTKMAKRLSQDSAIVKNGRICRILISANGGLYGDLPLKIIRKFVDDYKVDIANGGAPIDVIAVGSVGEYLLDSQNPKIPYKSFKVDDDAPKDDEINAIISYIAPYDAVQVTYGKFQSLLSLNPETIDITGGASVASEVKGPMAPVPSVGNIKQFILTPGERILFEPSVAIIARFFETEIIKALFRQKVFEMQLSRYASRMVSMDTATSRSFDKLKELKSEERRLKRKLSNKKLQQMFGGMAIW